MKLQEYKDPNLYQWRKVAEVVASVSKEEGFDSSVDIRGELAIKEKTLRIIDALGTLATIRVAASSLEVPGSVEELEAALVGLSLVDVSVKRLKVYYQDKSNPKQRSSNADTTGVAFLHGKAWFDHSSDGSALIVNPKLAAERFAELASHAKLPIRVESNRLGYRFIPDEGTDLSIVSSMGDGWCPQSFRLSGERLTTRILAEMVMAAVGCMSGKEFSWSWVLTSRSDYLRGERLADSDAVKREIQDAAKAIPFSARFYDVSTVFFLAAVDEVEVIRSSLTKKKDDIQVRFAVCNRGDTGIEYFLHASKEGYKLRVESNDPLDLSALNSRLGLHLK